MDLRKKLINNDNSTIVSDAELKASENVVVQELVADQMYILPVDFKQDPKVYDEVNRDTLTIQFEAKHANGEVVTLNQAAMTARPGEDIQQVYTQQFAAKAQEADRKVTDDLQAQVNCFSQQALYFARYPFEKSLEQTVEHPSLASQVVRPKDYNSSMRIPADVSKPLTLQVYATDFPVRAMIANKPCLVMVNGTISYDAIIEPIAPARYQELLASRAKRKEDRDAAKASAVLSTLRARPAPKKNKPEDSKLPGYILRITSIKASNPLLREILKSNKLPKDMFTKAEYKDCLTIPDRATQDQAYLADHPVPLNGSRAKAVGWGVLGAFLTCTLLGIILVRKYGLFAKSSTEYQCYQNFKQFQRARRAAVDAMVLAADEYRSILVESVAKSRAKATTEHLRQPEAALSRNQKMEIAAVNTANLIPHASPKTPTQGHGTFDAKPLSLPGQVDLNNDTAENDSKNATLKPGTSRRSSQ